MVVKPEATNCIVIILKNGSQYRFREVGNLLKMSPLNGELCEYIDTEYHGIEKTFEIKQRGEAK